jgi:predicted nucleic acid-binding Zn ribbon protein
MEKPQEQKKSYEDQYIDYCQRFSGRRKSGKVMAKNATSVANLAERLLGNSPIWNKLKPKTLKAKWPEIVGEHVSQQVELIDVRDGCLLLSTHRAVWKTELEFQKQQLFDRCNRILEEKLIHRLRWVHPRH